MTREEVLEYIKTEPNTPHIFEYEGYECIIKRMPNFTLNGYVGIGPSHPFFKKHYGDKVISNKTPIYNNNPITKFLDELDEKEGVPKEEHEYTICSLIGVHGGITYTSEFHPITDERTEDKWWIGFDTSHANDLIPVEFTPPDDDPLWKMLQILQKQVNAELESRGKGPNETYKDFNFVMKQIKYLVKEMVYYE